MDYGRRSYLFTIMPFCHIVMHSTPVFLESADIKLWSRLEEIPTVATGGSAEKHKAALRSIVEEMSININPVHSAVLVRMLEIAKGLGMNDLRTIATKVMEKCSLTDTLPILEATDILIDFDELDIVEYVLERTDVVSNKALLEYIFGKVALKEERFEDALEHFHNSNSVDPLFMRVYDKLYEMEPEAEWDIFGNIASVISGNAGIRAEKSFADSRAETLYRVYWEWYKGDRVSAMSTIAVPTNLDDSDFRLADARFSLEIEAFDDSVRLYRTLNDETDKQYIRTEFCDALIKAGMSAEAVPILSAVEDNDPLNRDMIECSMRAFTALNRTGDAVAMADAFLRTEHADRDGYLLAAEVYMQCGYGAESTRLIDTLISRFPDDHRLFLLRSSNELAANRLTSSMEAADEAVKLAPKNPECRTHRAKILREMGKNGKAMKDIDAAISADNGYVPAYILLKDIHLENKDYNKALKICNLILTIDEKNAEVIKDKAYALDLMGDKEGSLEEYRNALRVKDDKGLFEEVLTKLMSSGRYDELNDLFIEFSDAYEDSSMMWRLRGNVEYVSENYAAAFDCYSKAATLSPNESQLWHSKGMAAEKLGQNRKAEDAFDKALLLNLDNLDYWMSKAVIQEKQKNFPGAINALNRVITENPDSVFALVRKAMILTRTGKYDEALFFMDQALKVNSKDVAVADLKKDLLKYLRRYEQIVKVCDDILLVDGKNKDAFTDKIETHITLEEFQRASLTADRALKVYPDEMSFMYMKKEASHTIKDLTGEIWACRSILAIEPNNREVRMDLAAALHAKGDSQGAMEVYDRLYDEDPLDTKVVVMKSKVRSNMGDGTEAVALFQEAFENKPNDPETLNVLAEIMRDEGYNDEAKRVLDTAIKKNPKDVRNYKAKADILLEEKNYEGALELLKEALKLDTNDPQIWRALGEAQEARRDMQQALLSYDSAMKMGLETSDMYLRRGRIQEYLGMDDPAMSSYSMATLKDPKNTQAWIRSGEIQMKLGRFSVAAQNFNRALSIDPSDPYALFGRARVYAEMDDYDQAGELYERFKEINVQDRDLVELFSMLMGDDIKQKAADVEKAFMDDLEKYSHKLLEYCYNTGYAIRDESAMDEANVPEGMRSDLMKYLGGIEEYGDVDVDGEEFRMMERYARDLVLNERITKIEREPLVSLASAYMASGVNSVEEAKRLVAYVYKVMTEDIEIDDYPEDVQRAAEEVSLMTGDITLFGILEAFDLGLCSARMVKMLSGKMSDSVSLHV